MVLPVNGDIVFKQLMRNVSHTLKIPDAKASLVCILIVFVYYNMCLSVTKGVDIENH